MLRFYSLVVISQCGQIGKLFFDVAAALEDKTKPSLIIILF
jgi:hypothetical protein